MNGPAMPSRGARSGGRGDDGRGGDHRAFDRLVRGGGDGGDGGRVGVGDPGGGSSSSIVFGSRSVIGVVIAVALGLVGEPGLLHQESPFC